jgi:hypothetical protein
LEFERELIETAVRKTPAVSSFSAWVNGFLPLQTLRALFIIDSQLNAILLLQMNFHREEKMYVRIVLSILLALVCLAGAIGIGAYAYNLGIAQGMAVSGKVDVPATGVVPAPYFYRPFGFHPFGGFGFLSCLFPLFIIFVLFGVMRMVFWRARWGGMRHRHWDKEAIPPMVEEWHRKMHEQQPVQKV